MEEMMAWLNIPVSNAEDGSSGLQKMIEDTKEHDEICQDEYTTNQHVVVNDIASYEQMALILNVYYHATAGEKILPVVDLDTNPDAVQMHLQTGKYNQ